MHQESTARQDAEIDCRREIAAILAEGFRRARNFPLSGGAQKNREIAHAGLDLSGDSRLSVHTG